MPIIDKDVGYSIDVKSDSRYSLNFIIGYEQPGNIMKSEGVATNPMPPEVCKYLDDFYRE